MTATDLHSSDFVYQGFDKSAHKNQIISIGKRPFLYVQFEKIDRGSRGLSRYHRVREIYIDNEGRAFACFHLKAESGMSYRLAPFGRLLSPQEEGV